VPGAAPTTIVTAVAALLAAAPLLSLMVSPRWALAVLPAVVLVALAGWTLRRFRAADLLVVVVQLALLGWWLGVLATGEALPAPAGLVATIGDGVEVVRGHAAPLPAEPGAVVLLVACAGAVAIAADLVTAGLGRAAYAGPVLATGYLIAAGVLADGVAWYWFVPPAVGYLLVLAAEGRGRVVTWGRVVRGGDEQAGRAGRARRAGRRAAPAVLRTGRRVGLAAVSAAVVVPALLPGLGDGVIDGSLFAARDDGGSGGPLVPAENPIVDLHRNLTRPQDLPVLRYRTDAPEPPYLRVAVHDEFDGERWYQGGGTRLEPVGDGLPRPPGASARLPVDGIDITVTENYPWRSLPLPYPPRSVDIDGEWYYDPETLEVASPGGDPRGLTYHADIVRVPVDVDRLRYAAPPHDDLGPLLDLPAGAGATVDPYVDEAVGAATNRYEQARVLEAWFRDGGGFVYDTATVEPGTSTGSLLTFLDERRGYCEQYAATMAVMARRLGIPARVAVGFLPGDPMPDGSHLVTAHDAHAWPELWFEGTGWVAFDPTPPDRTPSPPSPPAEPPAGAPQPTSSPGVVAPPSATPTPGAIAAGGPGIDDGGSLRPGAGTVMLLAGALVVVLVTGRSLAGPVRRVRRWRRAAGDPRREAEAAWTDLRLAVRDAGLGPLPATPRATSARVSGAADLGDEAAAALRRVVTAVERARYAPRADPVPTLRRDAAAVRRAVLRIRPVPMRLRALLWPARRPSPPAPAVALLGPAIPPAPAPGRS
jgi:transglutaminase-like putative cysteine protease